jgi:regulator of replication initiation timing
LNNAQVYHDYVSKALVDERKTAKALQKESSSLEVQLGEVSESLEDECRAREKLKTENKRLRDDLAQRSKDSEAFVQNPQYQHTTQE